MADTISELECFICESSAGAAVGLAALCGEHSSPVAVKTRVRRKSGKAAKPIRYGKWHKLYGYKGESAHHPPAYRFGCQH